MPTLLKVFGGRCSTDTATDDYVWSSQVHVWDWSVKMAAHIRNHTALNIHELHGETPQTMLTGETADISHICEFAFYEWCWYYNKEPGGMKKYLARWLGPSMEIGDVMCAAMLKPTGYIIHRTTYSPLSVEDKNNPDVDQQKKEFEEALKRNLV